MPQFRSEILDAAYLFVTVLFFLFIYAFVSNQDYHEMFDKVTPIKYNCDMLIGGWHPDVPQRVLNECRKKVDYNGNQEKNSSNDRT